MKTKPSLPLFCFASGLLALPAFATAPTAISFPSSNTVAAAANAMIQKPSIKTGTTQAEVLARIGEPTLKLSATEWVYRDVEASQPKRGVLAHDNLIISFENGQVSELKLVRRHKLRHLIADAQQADRARATSAVIASTVPPKAR